MAMLEGIEAIYFDLDDTLCGYWDASRKALADAFAEHPVPGRTAEEMVQAWARAFRAFGPTLKHADWYPIYLQHGEPTRTEQMRRTLAEVGVEDEGLATRLSESYARRRDENLTLFPEVSRVLDSLYRRFPLGLITNGPADIQRQEIATLGVGHYFNTILIEGEMGEGKPNASVLRRAEAAVGCDPAKVLFVGNSYLHDIRPAIEAGWRTMWVRRPSDVPPSADGTPLGAEERPVGSPEPDWEVANLELLLDSLPVY